MKNKQEILGQYFTKSNIVEQLLNLVFLYKKYDKNISILEPSFGTGNFIKELNKIGYANIDGCEIDEELTTKPTDFFNVDLDKKYDLIIGNPPFSKYNLAESYFWPGKYATTEISPTRYLTKKELKKSKEKIENAFILKCLKHLEVEKSTIGFVLPVSFFIKNKNKSIKDEVLKYFSTIIIYQNDQIWFDRNIPCCFAIFTNIESIKNKVVVIYENGERNEETFDIKNINDELIPAVIFHKNSGYLKNDEGTPLKEYLENRNIKVSKSFCDNNISAKNILEKNIIPQNKKIEDYDIAVVRVGNSSVGKSGLINSKEDILNDMFYVFEVKNQYQKNKRIKENICLQINNRIDYFRNITFRVGSKSIKKEDIMNFRVNI